MTSSHLARQTMVLVAAATFLLPGVSNAHEAHKNDMSDAEMMQMKMQGDTAMHTEADKAMHEPATVEQAHRSAKNTARQQAPEQAHGAEIAKNRVTSAGDLLGRLHPIAAHFPIALLLMAALAELLFALRPSVGLAATVRFLVAGGATGAVVAAVLGWFAAGWRFVDRSETLAMHRWNGTAIAGVTLVAAWLALRSSNRTALRIVLAALAAALVIQGYLGGEMVFGPNHLGI